MGKTLSTLSKRPLVGPAVFDRRFVVELCERFHVHYRNLRIQLNLADFVEFCQGVTKAYERWQRMDAPEPRPGIHVELCRRVVAQDAVDDQVQVNLNENLYLKNEGRIFAEGAGLQEPYYIHLKLRDLRLEMTVGEFRQLSEAVKEAEVQLANCHTRPVLQAP